MLRKIVVLGALAVGMLSNFGTARARSSPESHAVTQVHLLAERAALTPGDVFDLGVQLVMPSGWHTYAEDPGDSGMPTQVTWNLPPGFIAEPLRWPRSKTITAGGLTTHGYEGQVVLLARLHVPASLPAAATALRLAAQVEWLECREICRPGETRVALELPISAQRQDAAPETLALLREFQARIPPLTGAVKTASSLPASSPPRFWGAFVAAFLGGLILNIMPCVLPVIAIKILGFVQHAGGEARVARWLGLWFGAGVLVSFWALAGVVIALQTAGQKIGWGFHFQNPAFLVFMALVVTAVALNFFGLFEVTLGGAALQSAGGAASRRGAAGAFASGALATALATPCTAPFLSAAMFYAFSQPPARILLIFSACGLGLALPYVILAAVPGGLRWIPRPGVWMLRFKQVMGFPMLATALWLAWTLGAAHGLLAMAGLLLILLLFAFAVWLAGLWRPNSLWPVLLLLVVAFITARAKIPLEGRPEKSDAPVAESPEAIAWQAWSPAALAEALKTGRPVFVDFTATWCLTCQVNHRIALENEHVRRRFHELDVIALRGDWTRRDDAITDALKSFGRSGVPLDVIYPADRAKPPIVLPSILTPSIVLDALEPTVSDKP